MGVPQLDDILDRLHVVALPMRVRFRGITVREVALIEGPAGWGEFGAFLEYEPPEAAHWLASAIEAAYEAPPDVRRDRIPINATVPAVDASQVPEVLARFPGARTAKVKVAEPGQSLADDVARVNAVRALVPTVRVDANGGWSVDEAVAAAGALTADGPLEYLEQPCATVRRAGRAAAPRRRADRRRREHPQGRRPAARRARKAADVAVLKVAPLGGVAQDARDRRADRHPDRGVQRAGLGGRHRTRTAGRRRAARAAARLRPGHRRTVRRRRRRARRRPSTGICPSPRSLRTRRGCSRAGRRRRIAGSGGSTGSGPALPLVS